MSEYSQFGDGWSSGLAILVREALGEAVLRPRPLVKKLADALTASDATLKLPSTFSDNIFYEMSVAPFGAQPRQQHVFACLALAVSDELHHVLFGFTSPRTPF